MPIGFICKFSPDSMSGFIAINGARNVWFHADHLSPELRDVAVLVELPVEFEIRPVSNGRQKAVNVRRLGFRGKNLKRSQGTPHDHAGSRSTPDGSQPGRDPGGMPGDPG